LCGKAVRLPLYRLLGGPFRTDCRIYNTCAGGNYNNQIRQGSKTELLSRDEPDDFALFAHFASLVPDLAARRRILVDNPAELYRFPPAGEGGT
jgi:L-alanine-DL-glutamate epimerase-like enolase superfamily enzyme